MMREISACYQAERNNKSSGSQISGIGPMNILFETQKTSPPQKTI